MPSHRGAPNQAVRALPARRNVQVRAPGRLPRLLTCRLVGRGHSLRLGAYCLPLGDGGLLLELRDARDELREHLLALEELALEKLEGVAPLASVLVGQRAFLIMPVAACRSSRASDRSDRGFRRAVSGAAYPSGEPSPSHIAARTTPCGPRQPSSADVSTRATVKPDPNVAFHRCGRSSATRSFGWS